MLLFGTVAAAEFGNKKTKMNTFTIFKEFPGNKSTSCNSQAHTVSASLVGVCIGAAKITEEGDNMILTSYSGSNCTGNGTKIGTALKNKCTFWPDLEYYITFSSPEPISQACSSLRYPMVATYLNNKCTMLASASSEPFCAVIQPKNGGNKTSSTKNSCQNGIAMKCIYQNSNCQGDSSCTPFINATNECSGSAGLWTQVSCPTAANANPVCPASLTTKNSKPDDMTTAEVGGVVAVVIIVLIIIIVVVVVALVVVRNAKNGNVGDGLMDDQRKRANYGGAN